MSADGVTMAKLFPRKNATSGEPSSDDIAKFTGDIAKLKAKGCQKEPLYTNLCI
jgi:hypothetical protein